MIDLMRAMEILASGKPLPQSKLPEVTPEMAGALQDEAQEVLNEVLQGLESIAEDPEKSLMLRLEGVAAKYGWYPTSIVLCHSFARRYGSEMVPSLSSLTTNTIGLLRMLPLAAEAEDVDGGAWTIPAIMIAEAGEQEALEFTACVAFCAGIGIVENFMKDQARSEAS